MEENIFPLDKMSKVCQLLRLQDSWGKTDTIHNDEDFVKFVVVVGRFYLDMKMLEKKEGERRF